MVREQQGFGDIIQATLGTSGSSEETLGIEGHYHVECRDAEGNLKWEEEFPNLVNAPGKQLLLDTLLRGSAYSVTGPFLGLISGASPTFAVGDTLATKSWTEFTAYTVSGGTNRGTAVFSAATNNAVASPSNVVTSSAAAITYTITGAGGTVGGCFLVTGASASATFATTTGVLYSAGAFSTAKVTTVGDTVAVTYSTTATS
jgi:hypothetical protein